MAVEEEWVDLPERLNLSKYQITATGRIRNKTSGHEMKCILSPDEYVVSSLRNDHSRNETVQIHRLIAETFIDNPDGKPVVDHINRIRYDNRISNLRWATHTENLNNRTNSKRKGRQVYQLTVDGIIINLWDSIKEASVATGICNSGIVRCCKKESAYSGGYLWRYFDEFNPLDGEIWKKVPINSSYDIYASNYGRIKKGTEITTGRINKHGYMIFRTTVNDNCISMFVHRLVCLTFNGKAPNGRNVVNHINNKRNDNRPENLEWTTQGDNNIHAIKTGSRSNLKPVVQRTMNGKYKERYNSIADASRATGISASGICTVCKGKGNYAGGYLWEYENK